MCVVSYINKTILFTWHTNIICTNASESWVFEQLFCSLSQCSYNVPLSMLQWSCVQGGQSWRYCCRTRGLVREQLTVESSRVLWSQRSVKQWTRDFNVGCLYMWSWICSNEGRNLCSRLLFSKVQRRQDRDTRFSCQAFKCLPFLLRQNSRKISSLCRGKLHPVPGHCVKFGSQQSRKILI